MHLNNTNPIAQYCRNPDDSYDIVFELHLRKLLEKFINDPMCEFQKNSDKFGYDISVFRYTKSGDKEKIGFIELEDTPEWKDNFPRWKYYSFVSRKIEVYNYTLGKFIGVVKNELPTIYLKHSYNLKDCYAASIHDIFYNENAIVSKNTYTGNDRLDYCYNFVKPKENAKTLNAHCVKRGWGNVSQLIQNTFSMNKTTIYGSQQKLF